MRARACHCVPDHIVGDWPSKSTVRLAWPAEGNPRERSRVTSNTPQHGPSGEPPSPQQPAGRPHTGDPPPGTPDLAASSGGAGRRGLIAGGIAVVLALVLRGGAYAAYTGLSGSGAQPAAALPGNAIAYVRIDMDPSASQKINAIGFVRQVP